MAVFAIKSTVMMGISVMMIVSYIWRNLWFQLASFPSKYFGFTIVLALWLLAKAHNTRPNCIFLHYFQVWNVPFSVGSWLQNVVPNVATIQNISAILYSETKATLSRDFSEIANILPVFFYHLMKEINNQYFFFCVFVRVFIGFFVFFIAFFFTFWIKR